MYFDSIASLQTRGFPPPSLVIPTIFASKPKFSTTATDGASLSLSVMEVVENFGLQAKIVGITSDGAGNIRVCREAMDSKYTNDSVLTLPKTLFNMECLVNILAGDCKAGVQ